MCRPWPGRPTPSPATCGSRIPTPTPPPRREPRSPSWSSPRRARPHRLPALVRRPRPPAARPPAGSEVLAAGRSGHRAERLRLGPPAQRSFAGLVRARFATQEAVVPKSRVRKRTVYTPPPPKTTRRKVSAPWVGPAIVACLVIGLAWIVTYYLTQGSVAGMSALGAWNLVVGFVFIIAGVILS